jgi:hypothetical protein
VVRSVTVDLTTIKSILVLIKPGDSVLNIRINEKVNNSLSDRGILFNGA